MTNTMRAQQAAMEPVVKLLNQMVSGLDNVFTATGLVTNAVADLSTKQNDVISATKKASASYKGETTSLTELRTRLLNVNNVTKDMEKTKLNAISTSKAWTAASRVLSGTGLWAVQNRIRAVIDVANIWEQKKLKAVEQNNAQMKAIKEMNKLKELEIKIDEELAVAEATLDDKAREALLMKNEQYNLMRSQGVAEKEALALLKTEIDLTKELRQSQKEKIFGTKTQQEATKAKAKIKVAFEEGDMGAWFSGQMELKKAQGKRWKELLTLQKTRDKFNKWKKNFGGGGAGSWKVIARKIGMMALTFLFAIAAIVGIVVAIISIIGLIKEFSDGFKEAWAFFSFLFDAGIWLIKDGLSNIIGGFSDIWKGLTEGDGWKALLGFGKIIWGLIEVFVGILLTILGGLWAVAMTALTGIFVDIWKKGENWLANLIGTIAIVTAIIAGVLLALLILPLLPGLAAVAVGALIIAGVAMTIKAIGKLVKKIPGFAAGGVSAGGLSIVGESGPELVNLPSGSTVHSNKDSKKIVGGSSVTNNITVNVKGSMGSSDAEIRVLADKIGKMIGKEINRTTNTARF